MPHVGYKTIQQPSMYLSAALAVKKALFKVHIIFEFETRDTLVDASCFGHREDL